MSNETSAAEQLPEENTTEPTAEQVAHYLTNHADFFLNHEELLADLRLPHESGDAVSLLERQISILRDRGHDARARLNHLLDNARNNDQLFETVRELVLAILRARDTGELIQVVEDKLGGQENIDACEIILVDTTADKTADCIRTETELNLQKDFADVFRLKYTHCGSLTAKQLDYLFGDNTTTVKSTALCPITKNGEVLGILAIGNQQENYFNTNLDTLFLDFVGNVIGATLDREL